MWKFNDDSGRDAALKAFAILCATVCFSITVAGIVRITVLLIN